MTNITSGVSIVTVMVAVGVICEHKVSESKTIGFFLCPFPGSN